ncbi:hypothetical protein BSK53_19385 [Paenibacillus odorifer]|nr:hypothetical protein BSK50_21340 [Paenibacillus odorifer]OMD81182.1 hypothetical protein BSK53_19385 [Paenibacillus odorifer]
MLGVVVKFNDIYKYQEAEVGILIMSPIKRSNPKSNRPLFELLDEFMETKKLQGISPHTYDDYVRNVNLFIKRYPSAWSSHIALKASLIEHLSQEGIAPSTFNNRLVYLRTFFK